MNIVSQVAIALFGTSAIFVVGSRRLSVRRWAYVLGLLSQPFWFYTTYTHRQWGIFALCFVYALSWVRGFYNHWIRTEG